MLDTALLKRIEKRALTAVIDDMIARLDHIEAEQRRQARVIAFIQRRQRAGGKLTRSLLAKQKRALQNMKLRYRGIGDESPIEYLRSYESGQRLFIPLGNPSYHYQGGNDVFPLGRPQFDPEVSARIRTELLEAAAKIGPVMGGEEEGSKRVSETTALRVLPANTCDTCGTELIDDCLRCGAPVCCPKCCEEDTKHVLEERAKKSTNPVKMTRFLLAVDENGVHIRKTLCVTHDTTTGEAVYDTEPINRGALEKAIAAALIHHPENLPVFESALSCAIADLSLFHILIDSAS